MQFAPLIKEIGRGIKGARDMDAATAEALFGAILDGAAHVRLVDDGVLVPERIGHDGVFRGR